MTSRFEIKQRQPGAYFFALKAGNGEEIAVSRGYPYVSHCKKVIERVKSVVTSAEIEDTTSAAYTPLRNPKFQIYHNGSGRFGFRLLARNGELILSGGDYTAKNGCFKGIGSIRANAPTAPVIVVE